jgi:hypothetical protein
LTVLAPDLVLHIGMQQSGATMLQRALSRLRPQLRTHGVAFIGHRRIAEFEHLAGWRCRADADPTQAEGFERELADAVAHEQKRIAEAGGMACGPVLIASDHLVGASNLNASDEDSFRSYAAPAIDQVIATLGAERVRLMLYTHRQDRLMEFCYLREIQKGRHHAFHDQFPRRFEPLLDYNDLIAQLAALPEVTDIRVRPFELVAAGPRAFIDDFLGALDLSGALDLDSLPDDLEPHHVYSRRGLRIALDMNPHVETARDRKLVRQFLLDNFAAGDDRQSRFMPKRERRRILAAYRDVNRRLFRSHMPDLPEGGYDDNAATARLAGVLAGYDDHTGDPMEPASRVTSAPPMLVDERTSWATTCARTLAERVAASTAGVTGRWNQALTPLASHAADHSRLLYGVKVRVLARRCDALVVSFPKCGRTWLRMMLGTALSQHYGVTVRNLRRLTDADVDHPGLPRVLATHDDSPQAKPPHRVMRSKRAYAGTKVVLLVRDPRDVVVSLYFHVTRRRRLPYDGDLIDFVRDRVGGLASLLAFYDAWAPHLTDDNVLLVRYEDMHVDPHRELRRMLGFLGVIDVDDAVVQRAVDDASFDRLQRLERYGSASTRALRTPSADDPESYKVRRGKIGGYRDYLGAPDIAAIDAAIGRSGGACALGYVMDRSNGPDQP